MDTAILDDFRYLQAELARIDLLLRREVRRWVLAGQDLNDDYRGLYIAQTEAEQLLERPFGYSWGQLIELPPEEEVAFAEALSRATSDIAALAAHLADAGVTPRLRRLALDFDLDRMALDILLVCLAPAFDTRYERIYGYLQDNVTRRRPSVRLVLDLFGQAGVTKFLLATYLHADAPLFRSGLLEYVVEAPPANAHWINQTLNPDETVVAWLQGKYQPQPLLGEHARLVVATDTELGDGFVADKVIDGAWLAEIRTPTQDSPPPLLAFYGVDVDRQEAAARHIAENYNQPLLQVHLNKIINENCSSLQAVRLALRDARLTGALPFLCGWDACLNSEGMVDALLLAALDDYPGLLVMAGQQRWQPGGIARQRAIFTIEFAMPDFEQRLTIWQACLRSDELSLEAAESDKKARKAAKAASAPPHLADLAAQFMLTSGQICDAVASARDSARQAGRAVQAADLFAMARRYSQSRLGALATKIEPRYSWEDLILPQDSITQLRELVDSVRGRAKVLDKWGVGKKLAASNGVSALFTGPPGTGKTMAAEVIGAVLGYDLYKIDLSTVVSKYIGETEKNLERIFSEATHSNAILFFDEADALFGKRAEVKDAHDRFANIEISYLLQRMERYDGVAILATNLRAHLDDAFTRRLHFIVAFPFPQRADRYRIWQALFPPDVPHADDLDGEFQRLAERFELTGANIRNIIYSAANLAAANGQVVTTAHLRHGVKRELQKMGRTVGVGDF